MKNRLKQILDENRGLEIVSVLFFYFSLIVIPLYMEDRYFNILEAKWHIYVAGSSVLLFAAALILIKSKGRGLIRKACSGAMIPLDWLIVAFALNALISSMLSSNFKDSFLGMDGWHVGAFTIVTLAVWYLILKDNLPRNQNIWLPVMIVTCVIVVIAMIQAMRIDIFQLHLGAHQSQYHKYITTLGNGNWVVGYVSLLFPLFLGFYLNSEDRDSERIYEVFLFLLCMLMVLTGSDGMYVGIGILAFFLLPYVFRDQTRFRKTMLVTIMYGVCLMMVSMLPAFVGKRLSMRRLAGFFLRPYIAFAVLLIGLIGYMVAKKVKSSANLIKAGRRVEIGLAALVGVISIHALSFFDHTWGTGRAWTWMKSVEKYKDFSALEKLFGVGPELLRSRYEDLSEYFGKPLTVSHSEPLQILLTMGAVGLIIWLAICFTIIFKFMKSRAWRSDSCIYYLPLFMYWGQSLVNSAMTTNVVVLIIAIAMLRQNMEEYTVSEV